MALTIPAGIVATIRERISVGTLRPGDALPSTRALAGQLGVSRGSVVTAFEQLSGEGFLVAGPGGTRVNPDLPARPPRPVEAPTGAAEQIPPVLRPGVPETGPLASTLWRRCWRIAASAPVAHPAPGSRRLRELIAEHVRVTRSVAVDADSVIITSGARDGLRLLLQVVTGLIAVEDPGYPSLHRIPEVMGREVRPIGVDGEGISIAELEEARPAAVLVMPNHQYPTGRQMPAERRFELIEWSRRSGALIVEDDYDSELRRAHPALAALDPGAVLLGSFAKTLTPALGLGYLIVPEQIRAELSAHAVPVSGLVQEAMAEFLAADGVRRHTARMRREYRRRREIFAEIFPGGSAMDGGLHAVIELREDAAEGSVVAQCRRAGLGVAGLGDYWTAAELPGVVLGLGGVGEERLRGALERLRRVLGKALP